MCPDTWIMQHGSQLHETEVTHNDRLNVSRRRFIGVTIYV